MSTRDSARLGLPQTNEPFGQATKRIATRKQLLETERQSIVDALRKSGGKIYGKDGAAVMLGMRPTTLTSKIAALGTKQR